jgi:ribonuclease HI
LYDDVLCEWQEQVGSSSILRGKQELTYAWGLGTTTNNQAEAYTLLQGLLLINASRVRTLIVIGDSSIIIKLMNSKKTLSDSKLASLIARIQKETLWFKEVTFFQVLRALNRQADILANEASKLNEGTLKKMGVYMFKPSPKFIHGLSSMKTHYESINQHMSRQSRRHVISSGRWDPVIYFLVSKIIRLSKQKLVLI